MKELLSGIWNMPKDQLLGTIENTLMDATSTLLMLAFLGFFIYAIVQWFKGRS